MAKAKTKLGWGLIVVLAVVPVGLWLMMMPVADRFFDLQSTMTSLGRLAALVGMVFFAVNLVLSGRFRFMEDFFGGMNRVYIVHHQLGGLAFILMMLHPLLLLVGYWQVSKEYVMLRLLPGTDVATNLGIAALLFMMGLLVVTYFIPFKYQLWRWTHKFLGGAFFLGGLHVFLIDSDVSINVPLRWYMLGLAGVALLVWLYRTVLGRFLVGRYRYVVEGVKTLGDEIVEIEMKPLRRVLGFQPGQFVFVGFDSAGVSSEVHPFSMSSAPRDAGLKVLVKSLGDYTNSLPNLKAGDKALVEGPYGRFSYNLTDNKKMIWIAGGIGVTPFLSMARSLTDIHADHEIDLYYSVHEKMEAVYLQELTEIAQRVKGFRLIPVYSKQHGRLSVEMVKKLSGQVLGAEIFICGPPPMMKALKKQFLEAGLKPENIHTEEFAML